MNHKPATHRDVMLTAVTYGPPILRIVNGVKVSDFAPQADRKKYFEAGADIYSTTELRGSGTGQPVWIRGAIR
jgi:hypothetical protein